MTAAFGESITKARQSVEFAVIDLEDAARCASLEQFASRQVLGKARKLLSLLAELEAAATDEAGGSGPDWEKCTATDLELLARHGMTEHIRSVARARIEQARRRKAGTP